MHARTISRMLAAGVLVGALGLQAMPAGATDNSITEPYVSGPIGDNVVQCQGPVGSVAPGTPGVPASVPTGIGGACFLVTPGTSLSVTASDATGSSVPGGWSFQDSKGNSVKGSGQFCSKTDGVTVPDGAAVMFVSVGVFQPNYSAVPPLPLACGTPMPNTQGTITVTGPGISKVEGGSSSTSFAGGTPARSIPSAAAPTAHSGSISDEPSQSVQYAAWTAGVVTINNTGCGGASPVGVGGVCFAVVSGKAQFHIADASGQKIGAHLSWRDAAGATGNSKGDVYFCNDSDVLDVPDGAAVAAVFLASNQALGPPPSPTLPCGAPTATTEGLVTGTGSAFATSNRSAAVAVTHGSSRLAAL